MLRNSGGGAVDLNGWRLRDGAGHEVLLSGSIAAKRERTVELGEGELPLNNSGDDIALINADGETVHRVSYTRDQVVSGEVVTFGW